MVTEVAAQLDVMGKICPYPVLETREKLKTLATDQWLEVISDFEPAATGTIPHFCRQKGYPYEVEPIREGVWRVLIQKTD